MNMIKSGQAIVIATTPDTYEWLNNLLQSLRGYKNYPIVILSDFSFELGKIRHMFYHTNYREFFLLQDSCEVLDTDIFDIVFNMYSGRNVFFAKKGYMYLNKYTAQGLEITRPPLVRTKAEAIEFENSWHKEYAKATSVHTLFPNFNKSNTFKEMFGRTNMVIENQYIRKYKGTWDRKQLS